jgi:hypothetical protein
VAPGELGALPVPCRTPVPQCLSDACSPHTVWYAALEHTTSADACVLSMFAGRSVWCRPRTNVKHGEYSVIALTICLLQHAGQFHIV